MTTHSLTRRTPFVTICCAATVALATASAHAQDWVPRPIVGPSARQVTGMVYDLARLQTVLYGGRDASFAALSDTWLFDGTSWTQATPATNPPPLEHHAMSYDAARAVVTMFGGQDLAIWPASMTTDTWEWNGIDWALRFNSGQQPLVRSGAAMAYDPVRLVTVMFGGHHPTGPLSDTWEWDGVMWTQAFPATTPAARFHHAMAYDTSRGTVVMFGGSNVFSTLEGTWEYDGTDWSQVITARGPSDRAGAGLAYDLNRGALVLHGGRQGFYSFLTDTWELRGGEWYEFGLATVPSNAGRAHLTMAYDPLRGQVEMFGGGNGTFAVFGDTWEFGGTRPSWASYGVGCAGTAGVPVLSATSLPAIGGVLDLQVTPIPDPAFVFFAASFGPTNLPIPGTSCRQHVTLPATTLGVLAAGGLGTLSLTIPNTSGFAGLELYFQGLIPDAVNPSGVAVSDAGRAVIY